MDSQRTPETILSGIAGIPTMERGRLCEMHAKSGRLYHNLQYWSNGANRCEYIRAADLDEVRKAVANYEQYRNLTQEYAAVVEGRTRQARRGAQDTVEKKGSATKRRRPPSRKSRPSSTG